MNPGLFYELCLTQVPHVGTVQARILIEHFGNAERIFKAKRTALERIEGIGEIRAKSLKEFNQFETAEQEIAFIEKYKIQPLFITDEKYPKRLLNCYDPPTMLFYKGTADMNTSKIISIIGTRNNTDYGKEITEQLIKDLSMSGVLVVSGMAFGIDSIAHKAALKYNLPTIGVLAHGLDKIYPSEHASIGKQMIDNGGLLTEYLSKTKPDKHNFPTRNRIVAGMADATIVIETAIKGGSMITAELANSYNKDVFAFPGKINDKKSAGCNYLIKNNKAVLLTDAEELLQLMGWEEKEKNTKAKRQRELFIQLSNEEKTIVDILQEKETAHIDELNHKSSLSSSKVASAILSLELQNVIMSLPGKLYRLS